MSAQKPSARYLDQGEFLLLRDQTSGRSIRCFTEQLRLLAKRGDVGAQLRVGAVSEGFVELLAFKYKVIDIWKMAETDERRQAALTDYRKKLLQHKELDARVKTRKVTLLIRYDLSGGCFKRAATLCACFASCDCDCDQRLQAPKHLSSAPAHRLLLQSGRV